MAVQTESYWADCWVGSLVAATGRSSAEAKAVSTGVSWVARKAESLAGG